MLLGPMPCGALWKCLLPHAKIPSAVVLSFEGHRQVLIHVVGVCIEHLGSQSLNLFISDVIALGCRDTRTVVTGHTSSRRCCASIGYLDSQAIKSQHTDSLTICNTHVTLLFTQIGTEGVSVPHAYILDQAKVSTI